MRSGMLLRGGVFLTFAVLAAGCGGGGDGLRSSVAQAGDTVSTTRTIEGLRFTATSRAVYSTTEPVTVTLTVENITDAPIPFDGQGCGNGGPRAFVRNENGDIVGTGIASGGSAQGCTTWTVPEMFPAGRTDTYVLVWDRRNSSQAGDDAVVPVSPTIPGTFRISPTLSLFSIGNRQFSQTDSDANGNPYPAVGPDPLTVTVRQP